MAKKVSIKWKNRYKLIRRHDNRKKKNGFFDKIKEKGNASI
jgi:hypothetical protein